MDIKRETLNRYINILMDAKIIYECKRFDLKSKKSINGEQKYYLSDMGSILQQILITELIMDQPLKMLFLTMQNQRGMISVLEE